MEPHVVELCRFLRAMGASIEGEGTSTIRVEAPARLRGAQHRLDGDYIEAGSWGVVAAITGGDIEVTGARARRPGSRRRAAARRWVCDCITRRRPLRRRAVDADAPSRRITTGLWPGFPSDMVSLVTVLATQADGRTLVHDWLYELRLFALEQMSAMRADLFLCDPHRIIVSGPTKLRGRDLDSRDLRSGMALIAAALAAEGESRVTPLETVERGYGALVERLQSLGAQVEREADEPTAATGDRAGSWQCRGSERRAGTCGCSGCGNAGAGAGGGRWRGIADHRLVQRSRGGSWSAGQLARRAARVAAQPERPQIRFGQIEHADDVRRQRQDDVGLLRFLVIVGEQMADQRQVAQARARRPAIVRSSSRISPASMLVSPSFSRIVVVISRLPNVGSPPKPVPEMLLSDDLQRQRHLVVVMQCAA